MRIVICEDEQVYRMAIDQAVRRWQASTGHMDVEMRYFASSEDFADQWKTLSEIDLLFVDIQFPGEMNGVELARKIRETNQDMTIVFCTNYGEYVYEGYKVNALRYLKKPVSDEDIFFCCSYVYNRLAIRGDEALTVFSGGKRVVLRHAEIRSIEAHGHNLYFHSAVEEDPVRVRAKLTDIQSRLPAELFVLCHRSYIVNVMYIRTLTRTECHLSNGKTIPISRTYVDDVNQAFDRYHQGNVVYDDFDKI